MKNSKLKTRESNFELLRLVAMFCIVFYHLLLHYVVPAQGDGSVFYALWLPLHIGVPLFVFISGYFGIRPSLAGGGKTAAYDGGVFPAFADVPRHQYR